MHAAPNPADAGRSRQMLIAVLLTAIVAMLFMVVAFGHHPVRAEGPAPLATSFAAPIVESLTASPSDPSVPAAATVLEHAPGDQSEPPSTF